MKRTFALVAVATTLAVGTAGISSAATKTTKKSTKTTKAAAASTAAPTTAAATTAAPTTVPAPAKPAGQPTDPNGVLKIAYNYAVSSWDIQRSVGGQDNTYFGFVYDKLVNLDKDGIPIPGLATSWSFDSTRKVLTLKLRPGVTFTDGAAFDATVVKRNLDRSRTLPASTMAATAINIVSVDVVDPMTVNIVQKTADLTLVSLLTDRLGYMISPKSIDDPQTSRLPVGSGPLKLVSQQPGTSYVFERNEGNWDNASTQLKGVEVRVYTDSRARLNAVRSGEADLTIIDPDLVDDARRVSGATLKQSTALSVQYVWINPKVYPPFADPKVRQALNIAIDRSAIVNGLLFGNATPTNQPFAKGSAAYNAAIEKDFTFSPDRAKKLLEEAGYPNGLSFNFVNSPGVGDELSSALQAQFARAGIKITTMTLPGTGFATEYWNQGKWAAGVARSLGRTNPALQLSLLFSCPATLNPGCLTTPEVNKLIDQAQSEPDPIKSGKFVQEAAAILAKTPQSAIPIYNDVQTYLFNNKVVNVDIFLDGWLHVENGIGIKK